MEPLPPELVYNRFEPVLAGPKMEDGVLKWTHGPSFEDGGIRFRLWAPDEEQVALVIEGRDPSRNDARMRTDFSKSS